MKRLLVPVDGSDASLRAVKAAVQAVQERSTPPEVHLLTVQAPILSGNVTRFFTAEAIESYYQEEGAATIASAKQILDEADINYQSKILVGNIALTIMQYVEEQECDHIVMGTRGLGAVTRVFLGSVTTKVLSLSEIPVTLVP